MSSSSMSPAGSQAQASSSTPIDSVEWPLERFPLPPEGGAWFVKSGLLPRPKIPFPPPLSGVASDLPLDPPLMAFIYPPPPPLDKEDPNWLQQMFGDVNRQRSHFKKCLAIALQDAADAYVETTLAREELKEERDKMQAFLHTVGNVSGAGYVKRMLRNVTDTVELMSMPPRGDSGYPPSPVRSDGDSESAPSP